MKGSGWPKRLSILAVELVTVAVLSTTAMADQTSTVPPGYHLVWADEFDGPSLDMTQWSYRIGVSHESYQRPENISIDNGAVRISLKRETFGGKSFTGGGVITRRAYRYGYFEARAKMFAGQGWHEAFWTTFIDSLSPDRRKMARLSPTQQRIEIDSFEQFAKADLHTFSYGIIEWYPSHGSISRDLAKVEPDLSEEFHTFGFEVAPDFISFYFDGRLLRCVDMRDAEWCPFYVWLTCIATASDAQPDGACWFDYLRIYAITPEQYAERRKIVLPLLDAQTGPVKSAGTDLWIEAEQFPDKGGWLSSWNDEAGCLQGHTGKDKVKKESDRYATTRIDVPSAGDYILWVRSRDYASGPAGKRTFRVAIGQQQTEAEFGAHGKDGWEWQNGGVFHLDKGLVTIRLIDTGAYYGRCDKLLLTTDREFIPHNKGGRSNVQYQ